MESVKETQQSNSYTVFFGNAALVKSFCNKCEEVSIVIDGLFACCDSPCNSKPINQKRETSPVQKRKKPSKSEQINILKKQNYACIYCGLIFDETVRLVWDHFIPFAYSQNNKASNLLASCDICNQLKSDFFFNTIEDAQQYILKKREQKKYEINDLPLLRKTNESNKTNEEVLLECLPNEFQHSQRHSNKNIKTSGNCSTSGKLFKNKCDISKKENKIEPIKIGKNSRSNSNLLAEFKEIETFYEPDAELVLWLKNFISDKNRLEEVCNFTKKSRTTVEAYVNCIYFKPKSEGGLGVKNSNLEQLIRNFKEKTETIEEKENSKNEATVSKTIEVPVGLFEVEFTDTNGKTIGVINFQHSRIVAVNLLN